MAMELLFENHTQLDEDVIHHIIEKDYKRPEKAKQYHVMTLLVGILAALAAVYFGRLGILTHQMLTLLCTIALIAVCIYSFYSYYQNMPKNQIKARQNTYSESLLIPRKESLQECHVPVCRQEPRRVPPLPIYRHRNLVPLLSAPLREQLRRHGQKRLH